MRTLSAYIRCLKITKDLIVHTKRGDRPFKHTKKKMKQTNKFLVFLLLNLHMNSANRPILTRKKIQTKTTTIIKKHDNQMSLSFYSTRESIEVKKRKCDRHMCKTHNGRRLWMDCLRLIKYIKKRVQWSEREKKARNI